jgi:hypothetical protein
MKNVSKSTTSRKLGRPVDEDSKRIARRIKLFIPRATVSVIALILEKQRNTISNYLEGLEEINEPGATHSSPAPIAITDKANVCANDSTSPSSAQQGANPTTKEN